MDRWSFLMQKPDGISQLVGRGLTRKVPITMGLSTLPESLGLQTLLLSSMASRDMLSTVSPLFQLILPWNLLTCTRFLVYFHLEALLVTQHSEVVISRPLSWQLISELMLRLSLRTMKTPFNHGTLMDIPSGLLGNNTEAKAILPIN